MQSNTVASFTNNVEVSAEEVRALVGVAAKNFAGIVDGQDGVRLRSTSVTSQADGSATVAIVYEQDMPVAATPRAGISEPAQQEAQDAPPAAIPPLTLQMPGVTPAGA